MSAVNMGCGLNLCDIAIELNSLYRPWPFTSSSAVHFKQVNKPTIATMPPIENPYRKRPAHNAVAAQMGPQSQRRHTLQERTYRLASNQKRKAGPGDQPTIDTGEKAFDAIKDCPRCRAAHYNQRMPHRGHDKRCILNTTTRGQTGETLRLRLESGRLAKLFQKPLTTKEKASWRYSTKEAGIAFFGPRQKKQKQHNAEAPQAPSQLPKLPPPPVEKEVMLTKVSFCQAVTAKIADPEFVASAEKRGRAPLAMIALAGLVADKIKKGELQDQFDGLTFVVPPDPNMYNNPHYHALVGQQLLLVDWI